MDSFQDIKKKKGITMREYNEKKLTKKFDNYQLYVCADIIGYIRSELMNNKGLSAKTRNLINEFYDSIYNDVAHLKCDEFTSIFIVEEGRNYK